MRFDCPPGCGGCSCHIAPPCTHCTEHGLSEEDEAPTLCLDALGEPVKPMEAHPPLVPPTTETLAEFTRWHRLKYWNEACKSQEPSFDPPGSPSAMVQVLAVELENQKHSLHEAHQALGRGSLARQVLADKVKQLGSDVLDFAAKMVGLLNSVAVVGNRVQSLEGHTAKLEQLHVYHDKEFLRVDRITVDHNRQIHNALALIAELQRKVDNLEHYHEEWACHIELVRQAQKAQADRILDALAPLTADASTVANLVKAVDEVRAVSRDFADRHNALVSSVCAIQGKEINTAWRLDRLEGKT